MGETGLLVFPPPTGDWAEWAAKHGPPEADIVMVHGLNGGRNSTWSEGDVCWPRDLLYEMLPKVRVMTFGYDARIIFSSDTSRIRDYAKQLLSELHIARESKQSQRRKLVFVCHSLGGIVVKKALLLDRESPLFESTTGIVFFGTPHRGSSIATTGKFLSTILLLARTRPSILRNLEMDNKVLQEIAEDFSQIVSRFRIVSFYESKKLRWTKLIVRRESAIMNVSQEEAIPIIGDHREICRFSRSDSRFQAVWRAISRLIQAPMASENQHSGPNPAKTPREVIHEVLGHDMKQFLRNQEKPYAKSCDWILAHEKFQEWITSDDTHVLHVVGDPGSGKSTAAAWLFGMQNSWCRGRRCIIFSFQTGRELNTAASVWSSLLDSIGQADIDASQSLSILEPHNAVLVDDFESKAQDSHTTYIIDALDECDDTVFDFLASLGNVLERSRSPPKFLLLSRHALISQIDHCFKSYRGTRRIDMNAESTHISNVQDYTRAKVEELCGRRDLVEFRDRIISELNRRSNGVYLLPALTIKSLASGMGSPGDVRRTINGLPKGLTSIYSNALSKVAPGDQPRAASLLLWTIFATRPLTHLELAAAVEFCRHGFRFETVDGLDDEVSRDLLGSSSVFKMVGPLVKSTEDGTVTVVHTSAREYLLSLTSKRELGAASTSERHGHSWVWGTSAPEGPEASCIPIWAAGNLAFQCLEWVRFSDKVGLLERSLDGVGAAEQPSIRAIRSLIEYAVENLPEHVRQCKGQLNTNSQFVSFLGSPTGSKWIKSFWRLKDPGQLHDDLSPLHFCCALGLVTSVKEILGSHGPDYSRGLSLSYARYAETLKPTDLMAAVDIASMCGNLEVLKVLCEDWHTPLTSVIPIPAAMSSMPREAIGQAAFFGREETRARMATYGPLNTAIRYGQSHVAEYLLSRGSPLCSDDDEGKWPIEIAIDNKAQYLERILLSRHKSTGAIGPLLIRLFKGEYRRSIPRVADLCPAIWMDAITLRGYELEHSAGASRCSILHWAAAFGGVEIFDFVKDLAADEEVRDSIGRHSIHFAASAGHATIVKHILQSNPASRSLQDKKGWTPLHYAVVGASCLDGSPSSLEGRESVIATLIDNIPDDVRASLATSALNSLSTYEGLIVGLDTGDDDAQGVYGQAVRKLVSKAPSRLHLEPGFLHAAFSSPGFPLDVALEVASSPDETDAHGRTPLHVATTTHRRWGDSHRQLAASMNDVDSRDHDGATPLLSVFHHWTKIGDGSFSRVKLLLELGSNLATADKNGRTPASVLSSALMATRRLGEEAFHLLKAAYPERLQEWLEDDALPATVSTRIIFMCHELGWSLPELRSLIRKLGHEERQELYRVAFMSKIKPIMDDCHLSSDNGRLSEEFISSLLFSGSEFDEGTLELLIPPKGGKMDVEDEYGQPLLFHAAENGQITVVKYLLRHGASARASHVDRYGRTALYWAAFAGNLEIVKLLVEAGYEVSADAIGIAEVEGRDEMIKYLRSLQ